MQSRELNRPSDTSFFIYGGIFFVSMSVLIFQITLTRVFAIMMWYHFAYLIISLALLGFGASGTLLTILNIREKQDEAVSRSLAIYSLLFGLGIIVAFLVVTRIRIDSFAIWKRPKDFFELISIFLVLSVPFLMAGMAIGTCLSRYSHVVGKLYSVDLIGAALGAIICPFLLAELGLPATVCISALLALVGSAMFATEASRRLQVAGAFSIAVVLVLTIGLSGGYSIVPAFTWKIPFAPNKKTIHLFPGGESDKVLSSAIAQVDVSTPLRLPMIMGGDFSVVDRQTSMGRLVTQDGTAPTVLYKDSSNLEKYPSLDDSQAGSAYVALNANGAKKPDVMVIGVGGGIDVMIALSFDAASVTAVEINKAMIRMVTDDYVEFIGHLFDNPKVTLVHEDGRSHLQRIDKEYDIIQLSGVDTFTALSTGAYTLSESYLYTVEAITKMYEALKEDGYINYSRFFISEKPRETIRLVNTAHTALENMGIDDPWKNIVVLKGAGWASTMIRKNAFNAKEIEALRLFCEAEKFTGLIFHPYQASIQDPSELTDSSRRVRNDFDTLLRGSAKERKEFIDDYVYDLKPSTDNKPFFFNYFRLSKLFTSWKNTTDQRLSEYLPDFPVGHMILLSSLVIIVILAFVLIILPLRFLERQEIKSDIKLRTFVYFSALGVGFMFIEICLMQKFILFLGHPVYSMSVVLAGILAFSGFGALSSSRIAAPDRPTIMKLMIAIFFLSLFNAFVLKHVLEPMLSMSLMSRIVITLLLIAPTAFVLGMPFPLGIRMLDKRAPQLIPWGWAINGFLSVLSSILATVIAMKTGFSWVLFTAGMTYVVGLSLAPTVAEREGVVES